MFTFTFTMGETKIDYKAINTKVATDLIAEIKKMIASGKNTDGIALMQKVIGGVPTFSETGLLLSSMTFSATEKDFTLFIDGQRAMVMEYLNLKNNWTIFKESKVLDEFATKKYDEYLQIELNKI